jgi:hypothetical protein
VAVLVANGHQDQVLGTPAAAVEVVQLPAVVA